MNASPDATTSFPIGTLDGKARLANAPRPGEGDESIGGKQVGNACQVRIASEDGGESWWQVDQLIALGMDVWDCGRRGMARGT